MNEPVNEPKADYGQPKAEYTPSNTVSQIVEEPVQKIETFFQPVKEVPAVEDKPVVENKVEIETPSSSESEFTFVNKTIDQERVIERRNKLKEFNSRYQSFDNVNEFESIPAFIRLILPLCG